MGKSKKHLVGYRYGFGMMAVLAVKPITRLIALMCDNKELAFGPWTGGAITINNPTFFSNGTVKDGIRGRVQLYLNGSHGTDAYLQSAMGIDADLVPAYGAVAYAVFSDAARTGPFFFGNTPIPREMQWIGERTATTCPFGAFALIPYEHPDWEITVNDFNPLVMYWELLIKGHESHYGSSFADAAEVLQDEGFGIYYYGGGGDREAIQKEIERYVDGRTYIDRETGLREFALIRQDFDPDDLVVIGEEHLIDKPDLVLPRRELAFNTFEVTFSDRRKKFETSSLTVQDVAHAAAFGTRRGEPLDYAWATSRELATTLGLRDVRSQTAAGLSGTIRVSGLRPDLHEGSPFVLDLPTWGQSTVVCRILSIREGGILDNSVEIAFTEDVFGVEVDARVVDDLPVVTPPEALPAAAEAAFEAPYWLGLVVGGNDFADEIADHADAGFLVTAAAREDGLHLGYTIQVDDGGGYEDTGEAAFTGAGTLAAGCARMDATIETSPIDGLDVGAVILVGAEFMRVDSITPGVTWTLGVGRGCIDTAPVAHTAGETILSMAEADTNEETYTDGQSIDVKIQTFVTGDVLDIGDATALPVTFDSRAIRPYPPGRFQVDGSYDDGATWSVDPELTWVDRDRLLQVDEDYPEDHTDAGIGPEAGTTYLVRAECFDSGGASLGFAIETDVGGALTYTVDLGDLYIGTSEVEFSVASLRDGHESWTRPRIRGAAAAGVEITTSGAGVTTTAGAFVTIS